MRIAPGPYRVEGNKVKLLDHGEWYTLITVSPKGKWKYTPEAEKTHAKLFAAAPKLLEMAKESAQMIEYILAEGYHYEGGKKLLDQMKGIIENLEAN